MGEGLVLPENLYSTELLFERPMVVRFQGPRQSRTHPSLSLYPLYGAQVPAIHVHDWLLASPRERQWFCRTVMCRLRPGGKVVFWGWDDSAVWWYPGDGLTWFPNVSVDAATVPG